jgi:hypothetical protein
MLLMTLRLLLQHPLLTRYELLLRLLLLTV